MGFIFVVQINRALVAWETISNVYKCPPLSRTPLCAAHLSFFIWPLSGWVWAAWVSVWCVLELKCFNLNTKRKICYNQIIQFGFGRRHLSPSIGKIELTLFKWHFNDIIWNSFWRKLNFLNLRPFSNYKFRVFLIKIELLGTATPTISSRNCSHFG